MSSDSPINNDEKDAPSQDDKTSIQNDAQVTDPSHDDKTQVTEPSQDDKTQLTDPSQDDKTQVTDPSQDDKTQLTDPSQDDKTQLTDASQDDKNPIQNVTDKGENLIAQIVIDQFPNLAGPGHGAMGQGDDNNENKSIKEIQISDETNMLDSIEIQNIPLDTGKNDEEVTKILEGEKKEFAQESGVGTKTKEKKKARKQKEKRDSRIALAMSSSRTFIAWVTAGKIGPGFLVAPVIFFLVIHIMMFVLGIRYSKNCTAKPLVPVSMVLLGGDGLLKSLSYLLQIVIVIQTKMTRVRAMIFLSESSVLDNGLNSLYIVAVILGAAGAFTGEMATCQVLVFHFLYYYTIIILCVLGLIVILILWKLIKPNEAADFIDARGNVA